MIKRHIQDLSFKVSRYFRPFEPWHCGGQVDGTKCLLGPDKKGNCRAIQDCNPELENKTWSCTRSELLGGECKAGPTAHGGCGRRRPPCKPTRSLRARRRSVAWLTAATVLSITSLIVIADKWQLPINPGALSQQHAVFGPQACDVCHSAADAPRSNWLWRALGTHSDMTGSEKCVSCHALGSDSLATHSMPTTLLTELTLQANRRMLVAENNSNQPSLIVTAAKMIVGQEMETPACSVCHQEHQGVDADISSVGDRQCAACHAAAFDDFSLHPAFSKYPASERTQIIFSHNSHLNKHFLEPETQSSAPQACIDCHRTDSIGRKMEIKGFENSCSACHVDQINSENRASEKGIAMLSVPALDVAALQQRGLDLGEWPNLTDAEFTPLNSLAVAAVNPQLADKVQGLLELDLFDLESASDEELQTVYQVAWTLKRVYFELQQGGAQRLNDKLAHVLPAKNASEGNILAFLSPAVIEQLTLTAFPNLGTEMLAWPNQLKYRPNVDAATDGILSSDATDKTLKAEDKESLSNDDDWLSNALSEQDEVSIESDDDWLSAAADEAVEADDDDWLSSAADEAVEVDDDDWLALVNDDSLDDDVLDVQALDDAVDSSSSSASLNRLALEDRAAGGGWYFEDFYLRYRPSGHADTLIVSWAERLMAKPLASLAVYPQLLKGMQRSVVGNETPGLCMKCHSVSDDGNPNGQLARINWFGRKTKASNHDFNAFEHQSHYALMNEADQGFASSDVAGCGACHKINQDSDSGSAYEKGSAIGFQSDFHNLEKGQCASCHKPEEAISSCTTCHNYHIGERNVTALGIKSDLDIGLDVPLNHLEQGYLDQ